MRRLKIQNDYPKMDFTASIIINETSTRTEDFITVLPNKEEKTTSNSENTCLKYRFVISFCIGTFVLIGGTIGNGLATYTLWPSRKKNSTNFLLITLAFFDTCVLVVWYANTGYITRSLGRSLLSNAMYVECADDQGYFFFTVLVAYALGPYFLYIFTCQVMISSGFNEIIW